MKGLRMSMRRKKGIIKLANLIGGCRFICFVCYTLFKFIPNILLLSFICYNISGGKL